MSWKSFEENVREIASFLWDSACFPMKIAGVSIDGYIEHKKDYYILIEITEERNLEKIRSDIIKLTTAKYALLNEKIYTECYVIMKESPTSSMIEAGESSKIKVYSYKEFRKIYFNYENYCYVRRERAFGSHPAMSGSKNFSEIEYIHVNYFRENDEKAITVWELKKSLEKGNKIILLGEFGTGKSRCIRQLFSLMSVESVDTAKYPLAIDLRQCWGLKTGQEIVRRHFDDLGLAKYTDSIIRRMYSDAFIVMLDGFDEIGSQSWEREPESLKQIRNNALSGVRDIIMNSPGGVIVTGREHYFSSRDEMFDALGCNSKNVEIVSCYEEFTEDEMRIFLKKINLNLDLPTWLPRRPLVTQVVSGLDKNEIEKIFNKDDSGVEFWEKFIETVCEREAKIRAALSAKAIKRILELLSRFTRNKSQNIGPLSQSEINQAYETVTGMAPTHESAIVLQRLPGIGRIEAESESREFIDVYILDGLRSADVKYIIEQDEKTIYSENWINPIKEFGVQLLAETMKNKKREIRDAIMKNQTQKNKVILSDMLNTIIYQSNCGPECDFNEYVIENGHFTHLNLSDCRVKNLKICECIIEKLTLPIDDPIKLNIVDCIVGEVIGVSDENGLPKWIVKSYIEKYERVDTTSRIKAANLQPNHQILVTIIKKLFFQKGSGRKEEALLRGLGNIAKKGLLKKILNYLMNKKIIRYSHGNEGIVYHPVRSEAARMKKMLSDLIRSDDEIWTDIGKLN